MISRSCVHGRGGPAHRPRARVDGAVAGRGHELAVATLRAEDRIAREEPLRHAVGFDQRPGRGSSRSSRCSGSARWTSSPRRRSTPCAAADPVPPEAAREDLLRLDGGDPPLVHLAPAVVGAPAAGWFAPDGSYVVQPDRPDGDGLEAVRPTCSTPGSRPPCGRSRRWAGRRTRRRCAAGIPGNVLSTARDIINLWVARMIFTGIEFAGDIPFTDVYIHSTIQAADGRRMSKSLGTGVDPLDLIDRYGADATRYGLLKMCSTQDVRFAEGMIEEGRAFTNKLWNASRLVLLGADPEARAGADAATADRPLDPDAAGRDARRLATELYETYQFSTASRRCTRSSGTTSATGTSRRSRSGSTGTMPRRGGGLGDGAVRARAGAGAAAPGDAVRDRGDLALPADGERGLLIAARVPARRRGRADPEAARAVAAVIELVTELRRMRQDAGFGPREPLELAHLRRRRRRRAARAGATCWPVSAARGSSPSTAGGVPVVVGDARVLVGGGALAVALRGRLERRSPRARRAGEGAGEARQRGLRRTRAGGRGGGGAGARGTAPAARSRPSRPACAELAG